ncbi:MAG TPA: 16S rRNA (adenine(1518)-N(6)/adenine(1519)-N(6))-dimethyltransferase RsmA [Candidatus Paceibacterota bacterium]|nr:16S rRNA (adenine(1518)-N(6)/adenine(1519)-N(6))-dimethyltransferase RsmA [Candidatus Paceibacterota bacterium]HMO82626.1 16S rRNA (adenine(1518)-N(6)/adenine(1519)-N(6))-dimethyltransferase RsmA [Candidatus Paceibacterota bacterium]
MEENSPAKTKFIHKRSLGQNFLTSDVVPGWMVAAGEVGSSDTVLEIGPGTGMLTKALLKTGAKVIAVEADKRALIELERDFAAEIKPGRLTLHHGDARELTPKVLGLKDRQFKVIANIPYYLSGFLLRTLLENAIQPKTLVFLIQKELAERIARSKKESLLSLSVKAFGQPKYVKTVSRGHFQPPPKVDSAILLISDINQNHFKNVTTEHFFNLLHLGLGNKRKQLLSNLSKLYNRQDLESVFEELKISLTVRGEDVPLEKWLELNLSLQNKMPS